MLNVHGILTFNKIVSTKNSKTGSRIIASLYDKVDDENIDFYLCSFPDNNDIKSLNKMDRLFIEGKFYSRKNSDGKSNFNIVNIERYEKLNIKVTEGKNNKNAVNTDPGSTGPGMFAKQAIDPEEIP